MYRFVYEMNTAQINTSRHWQNVLEGNRRGSVQRDFLNQAPYIMNLDHTERVSEEAGEEVTCLLFKAQYLCKLLRSQRMIP